MFRVRRGTVDLDRRVVRTADGDVDLTPSEVRALAVLHAAAGRVVEREALLEAWGYASRSRSQAVHVALRRLRAKLEVDPSNPDHLRTVAGVGWVLEPLPDEAGLVGRAALLGEVVAALRAPCCALVGPGGVGKTSVARAVLAGRPGRWIDVAGALDGPGLEATVARALGADPTLVLARAGLVVLDNLEQVGPAAVEPVSRWVAAGARLLLTTRLRLPFPGELVEVPPLARDDAVALLAQRAGGAADPVALGPLADLLEGHPLSLELAAPRLRLLTPEALVRRLADRFPVLRDTSGRRPERHTSLAATIAASVDLLTPGAAAALRALAVFCGPFSPAGAEEVLGPGRLSDREPLSPTIRELRSPSVEVALDSVGRRPGPEPGPAPGALDALQELVDASLVHRDGDRLTLWVSVREWCGPPDDPEVTGRWVAHLARTEPNRVDRRDLADLVAALRTALAQGGPVGPLAHAVAAAGTAAAVPGVGDLLERAERAVTGDDAVRLARLRALSWSRTGRVDEALGVLAALRPSDALQRGLTREAHGNQLVRLCRYVEADAELAEAEAAFAVANRPGNSVTVAMNRASVAKALGRRDEARERMRAARQHAVDLGDLRLVAGATANLAAVVDDPDEAEALSRDAIALYDQLGNDFAAGSTRLNLSWMVFRRGDVDEADRLVVRALDQLGPLDLRGRARGLAIRGTVARARGDRERAEGWLLEALVDAERVRDPQLVDTVRAELTATRAAGGP